MKNKTQIKTIGLSSLAICLTIFGTVQAQAATASQPTASQYEKGKTCVLYFERKENPLLSYLQRAYQNRPDVTFVSNAKPDDMVKCVLARNPSELIIYAHNFNERSSTARLGYFSEKDEKIAARQHQKTIAKIKRQHEQIVTRSGYSRCDNPRKLQYPCNQLQKQELLVRHKLKGMVNLKPTDPSYRMAYSYQKEYFTDKSFADLHSLAKTANLNLKKIKLVSGKRNKVVNAYPGLKLMVQEQGIRVQNARPRPITLIGSHWVTQNPNKKRN